MAWWCQVKMNMKRGKQWVVCGSKKIGFIVALVLCEVGKTKEHIG